MLVFAYTSIGDGFGRPSRGEYFNCPLCSGTGEADAKLAAEWVEAEREHEEG